MSQEEHESDAQVPQVEIPKDLSDKWKAIQGITGIGRLLQEGNFPHRYNEIITEALTFLIALQKEVAKDALRHPSANLIQGLKEFEVPNE
jgi:hypothetical protein